MYPLPKQITFTPTYTQTPKETAFLSLEQCQQVFDELGTENLSAKVGSDSVWAIHQTRSQKGLIQAVESRHPKTLYDFLNSIHSRATLKGYDQHGKMTRTLQSSAARQKNMAKSIYRALIRLAAATGDVRHFNPAQLGNYPYLDRDMSDEIVEGVKNTLGIRSRFPHTAEGAFGLDTANGFLTLRHVIGLGYFREIQAVLNVQRDKYAQIVEIGGGFARTAYHVSKDIGLPYSIIDLPAVGLTQHFMLMANGAESVLWQEKAEPKPNRVNLRNAFSPFDPSQFENALFVNFDSFVEFGKQTQDDYFQLIAASGSDLLSINHEANKIMTTDGHRQNWNIARICELGFKASPRYSFWEREGYVVQFFENTRGKAMHG